jgi:hypothetical protein
MLGMSQASARQTTQEIVKPLAENAQTSSVDRYHGNIAQLAGADWEQVNTDPAFIAWTQQNLEPLSGRPYNALLNDAYHSGNAEGVAKFFNLFKGASQGAAQTQNQHATHVTGQEAMTAPTKRATSIQTSTDTNPGKVWTTTEIDTFYGEQERGRYKGREKEAAAIEAEIFKALATPGGVVGR